MSAPAGEPFRILLVEDDEGDVLLTREAFKGCRVPYELAVVSDGDEAEDYLRRRGRHEGASRPDVILLDLNLPGRDGRELLAAAKRDSNLRLIPIIVLTTSNSEADVRLAYDHRANCFLSKPFSLEKFLALARAFEDFWMTWAVLPPR